MLACVLIHFLLLLAGFGIPYAIKSMSIDAARSGLHVFANHRPDFFALPRGERAA